jgi:hypothetical protein
MKSLRWILGALAPALLLAATAALPCAAQQQQQHARTGFQLRIDDDAEIAPGESIGAIVVMGGDLEVRGDADLVIVVNGTAHVANATIGDLVVVDGQANLDRGSVVTGSVQTIQAVLLRDPDAVVKGAVRDDSSFILGAGLGTLGLLFGIGYSLALLMSAALFAGIFPRVAREAGTAMTHEFSKTALGALALWILIPIVAAIFATTIIGIPFAVGLFVFLLPTLAFIGYIVAAVRLGDAILSRVRESQPEDHPYGEALLGMLILVVASWIPGIGGLLTFLAFLGGSGALVLVAWRAIRSHEPTSDPTGVARAV